MSMMAMYFGDNEFIAILFLTCATLAMAFNDVITDSLMVIQARKYPEDGSEEL